jgi:uncharacterized DUF497 family protein
LFEVFDYEHSDDEDRYRTVGSDPENRSRVLLITWTERESDEGAITRIISARAATPRQQREYAERIQRRNRS